MKTMTSFVYTRYPNFHHLRIWRTQRETCNDSKSVIIRINILTKFHKDWMKNVTSIVYTSDLINILTKFNKDWMKTVTSIVYTSDLKNILTKFHKDWIKTVTSTVYTNKLLTHTRMHAQRTPDITRSHKLTMSLCDRRVNTGDNPFQSTLHLGLTSHAKDELVAISGL
ncbi:hypothetical protein DPMN_059392 [Dreissena polymorpha]|uniref:Uncharacterized protein n=1 Tax=Dreissena polymorpha TaxID=45954 RepID=A0A9D4C3F1_DREPO|nr:hypothetical protein DPMN_059392 [Dreissena polymorpha]